MNICIVNTFFPPHVSGTARTSYLLAERLSEAGHAVTVITSSIEGPPRVEKIQGMKVYRLRSVRYPKLEILHKAELYSDLLPENLAQIGRILRRNNIELVHVYGQFFDLTLMTLLAAKTYRLPVVLTIGTRLAHANLLYNTLFRLVDKSLVRHLVARRADRVIAMDRLMKDYITDRYGVETAVRFVPAGVDVDRFGKSSGKPVRTRYKLSEDDRLILSMGNLSNFRRADSLINALPSVLRRIPSAKILVVGSRYDTRAVKLVDQLGLQKSVVFCGRVEYDLIPSYHAACDVVANDLDLAPWAGMGVGLASLEAMASGKVVLTSANEDNFLNLRLVNWQNIVLVKQMSAEATSQALVKLLSNQKLAETIGQNARIFVRENFSLDSVCQRYQTVYEELRRSS